MDISVAIGRNVGEEPMSDERWFAYKADINAVLVQNGFNVVNREDGTSCYLYEDTWQTEPFHRVWAINPLPGAPDIRTNLRGLANRYDQWGIAYTVAKFTDYLMSP